MIFYVIVQMKNYFATDGGFEPDIGRSIIIIFDLSINHRLCGSFPFYYTLTPH